VHEEASLQGERATFDACVVQHSQQKQHSHSFPYLLHARANDAGVLVDTLVSAGCPLIRMGVGAVPAALASYLCARQYLQQDTTV
jgi:hypothetical protein